MREHVLDLMVQFNIAEMDDAVIDEQNQVSFILESLPKSFLQFHSNVVMNKIVYTMTTFLNELQTYQSLMKIRDRSMERQMLPISRSSTRVHPLKVSLFPHLLVIRSSRKRKKERGRLPLLGKTRVRPR